MVRKSKTEMGKHIEEFEWKKKLPSSPKDDNSV